MEKAPEKGSRDFVDEEESLSSSEEREREAKRQRRREERRASFAAPANPEPQEDAFSALQSKLSIDPQQLQSLSPEMQLQLLMAAAGENNMEPPQASTQERRFNAVKLDRDSSNATIVKIPDKIQGAFMTVGNKELLAEQSGCTVEFDKGKVLLWGSPEQINVAQQSVKRVSTHCMWGVSEDKIARILKPKSLDGVKIVMSPMGVNLKPFERSLSMKQLQVSIGKDKKINHLAINDAQVSRQHCIIELDLQRGAVYVMDMSTNGTFLNGTRLPGKGSGKVLLSHGDDLVFKDRIHDPSSDFGYIINIIESEEVVRAKSWEVGTWNANK